MANLLDTLRTMLTPDLADTLAARHDENRGVMDKLLAAGAPLLLTGLADTPADRLGPLARAAAGPAPVETSPDAEAGLLDDLFGARGATMAEDLARHAGSGASTAIGVLGMLATLAAGAIGRVLGGDASPDRIAALLRDEAAGARAALPPGFGQRTAAPVVPEPVSATPVAPVVAPGGHGAAAARPVAAAAANNGGWGALWVLPLLLLGVLAWWWSTGRGTPVPQVEETRFVREQPGADIPESPAPIDVPDATAVAAPPERAEYTVDTCNEDFRTVLAGRTVNFATASAEATPDSLPLLDALATVAARCQAYRIEIAGHTDAVGDAAANRALSQVRADTVRDYLADNNVPAAQTTAIGYGEDRPVEKTADETENAANRRIEFTVSQ